MTIRDRWSCRFVSFFLLASTPAAPLAAQVWEVGNKLLALPVAQADAWYGDALAIGDFNGDGFQDVVVGAPGWDRPTVVDSGGWWIYWGGASRSLPMAKAMYFGNVGPFLAGVSLAAGDFDHDGRDEIAVGAPDTGVGSAQEAGVVVIAEYDAGSWSTTRMLSQDDTPLTGPEDGDAFGRRVTVGDFDGDGFDDLAVSASYETWGLDASAGVVHVFYGSVASLRTDNAVTIVSPSASAQSRFGDGLAAGDFDNDGYDDLAIGAPGRTVDSQPYAGAVEVYFGSASGISTGWRQLIADSSFPGSSVGSEEYFGTALAAGNFNQTPFTCIVAPATCYTDLAIGVPGQDLAGHDRVGKVMVAYGNASGLLTASGTYLAPGDAGGSETERAWFGGSLAAGRLDPGVQSPGDLAIGSRDGGDGVSASGAVFLVFGATGGLNNGKPAQFVPQRAGFKIWPPLASDGFGVQVAIGDLDGDGWGDLVAASSEKAATDSGVVQVLYGALFADGFESGGTLRWSVP